MPRFRLLCFYVFLAFWTVILSILYAPLILSFNQKIISGMPYIWSIVSMFVLKHIFQIDARVHGYDKSVIKKPCIFACKHQSIWETIFLMKFFKGPVFLVKKELLYIPFYGWYIWMSGMIPVNREKGSTALRSSMKKIDKALKNRRNIVIFPEGTRVIYGVKDAKLEVGIFAFYKYFKDTEIIPIYLDSGKCINKDGISRKAFIDVHFKRPIRAGLDKEDFLSSLHHDINTPLIPKI
ncbi:MAG: 1-acyl-sn-glycerol-3-phosphate acyltransferase [Proteobacteria bacterium]|nr:1-acyl-sn-glycerol-3-phosphate acyltransferase [Pseudomonadota bacterium]